MVDVRQETHTPKLEPPSRLCSFGERRSTPRQPLFANWFAAAARTYVLDATACLGLFIATCLLAGRVWRSPFDDEVSTLAYVEQSRSIGELSGIVGAGIGFHPPLLFLYLHALHRLGLSEAGMRLVSLMMTGLSLTLTQLLTLAMIARHTDGIVRPSTRLLAALLFALSPLAIGVGDAIRWYPLFALLIALFLLLYVAGGHQLTKLASAVPLGLAASTNFIALAAVGPFLLYRYVLERRIRPAFDAAYWLLFSMFACLAAPKALSLASHDLPRIARSEFGDGPLRAVATDVLGFFGGNAVGIGQAWVVIPIALMTGWAALSAVNRERRDDPTHLVLLMLGGMLLMMLAGFAKPRSFLYLAPAIAMILTLFMDRKSSERKTGRWLLMTALILAPSAGAIANVTHSTRPFKRNAAIPFGQVLDFIRTNEKGRTLIISSDPVVVWELRHDRPRDQRCVTYFGDRRSCFASDRQYDSIFVISGNSNRSSDAGSMTQFAVRLDALLAGRRKVAELHAGRDDDAALKTWLTGVPLDEFILSVQLYR